MADILIRDVPDDVLAAIDDKARRAGISRSEYIRRALSREGNDITQRVRVDDLADFASTFAALRDGEIMRHAWS